MSWVKDLHWSAGEKASTVHLQNDSFDAYQEDATFSVRKYTLCRKLRPVIPIFKMQCRSTSQCTVQWDRKGWNSGPMHNVHIVQYLHLATEQAGALVWHHLTYVYWSQVVQLRDECRKLNFSELQTLISWFFLLLPLLYHYRSFGVLCPNRCLNTREFYYPPVSYTGQFWIQGDPTVQCAHCNVLKMVQNWALGTDFFHDAPGMTE